MTVSIVIAAGSGAILSSVMAAESRHLGTQGELLGQFCWVIVASNPLTRSNLCLASRRSSACSLNRMKLVFCRKMHLEMFKSP